MAESSDVIVSHVPTQWEREHGEWMPNDGCSCPSCEAWFAADDATWD